MKIYTFDPPSKKGGPGCLIEAEISKDGRTVMMQMTHLPYGEALPICKRHRPKKLPYIQWHQWAEKMVKRGSKQMFCGKCQRFYFPVERP